MDTIATAARDVRHQIAEILLTADGTAPWNGGIDAQVDTALRAALRAAYERGREDALRERQVTQEEDGDFERQSEILRGLHARGA